jgi:hypothetical protein
VISKLLNCFQEIVDVSESSPGIVGSGKLLSTETFQYKSDHCYMIRLKTVPTDCEHFVDPKGEQERRRTEKDANVWKVPDPVEKKPSQQMHVEGRSWSISSSSGNQKGNYQQQGANSWGNYGTYSGWKGGSSY